MKTGEGNTSLGSNPSLSVRDKGERHCKHEVYSVFSFFVIVRRGWFEVTNRKEKMLKIQILADTDRVDPITRVCTLENKDERIEQAIEESMEGVSW